MEDLKQIQEFFSKPLEENVDKKYSDFLVALRDSGVTNMFGAAPYLQAEFGLDKREAREVLANWMRSFGESLEEGKQLDIEDFAKVVQAVTKTGHPVTVLLVPKWNEIEIITGMNAPDDMLFDLSNAIDSLGYGRNDIIIAADSSNLSRREYSDIRRVNGGHKDYFEEAKVEEAYIVTYAKNKGEKPASAAYKLRGSALAFMRDLEKDGYITMLTQRPVDGVDEAIEEYNTGIYYDPAKERNAIKAKQASKSGLKKVRDFVKKVMKEEEITVDDATEFKLNLKHLLDKHVVKENEEQQVKVGNYQTKHFDICPGAVAVYKDIEVEDMDLAERAAKLQDALFAMEKEALESGASDLDVEAAQILADQIMAMAKMMGLEKEHSYVQGHVEKIKGTLSEALSDFEEEEANYDELYSDYKYKVNEAKPKKATGEKISKEVFAKLKGKTINYKGHDYKVVDSDEAVLKIKHLEDGDTTTINLRQFNVSGMIEEILETIELGRQLEEGKLCPKGEAYRKRRMAAGEKSSAYLSGRAVKVCKGQMSGKKKK